MARLLKAVIGRVAHERHVCLEEMNEELTPDHFEDGCIAECGCHNIFEMIEGKWTHLPSAVAADFL